MMTDKMIEKFENAGFRRWTKYGNDRLYIDAEGLGLSYSRRNSGSIAYAEWQGEKISNNHARDMISCKMYVDVTTGEAHFDGNSKYVEDAFNSKIEELMQGETEKNAETADENDESNEMEDMKMANYINIYRDEDNNIWFEDEQDRARLNEWVELDEITYDEHHGYILPDGRNLTDIIAD